MKLKLLLQLLFGLTVFLSSCQTYASTNSSFSENKWSVDEEEQNTLLDILFFEQIISKRSCPGSSGKSFSFYPVVTAAISLSLLNQNEETNQNLRVLLDLRYALSIQIFPSHYFW